MANRRTNVARYTDGELVDAGVDQPRKKKTPAVEWSSRPLPRYDKAPAMGELNRWSAGDTVIFRARKRVNGVIKNARRKTPVLVRASYHGRLNEKLGVWTFELRRPPKETWKPLVRYERVIAGWRLSPDERDRHRAYGYLDRSHYTPRWSRHMASKSEKDTTKAEAPKLTPIGSTAEILFHHATGKGADKMFLAGVHVTACEPQAVVSYVVWALGDDAKPPADCEGLAPGREDSGWEGDRPDVSAQGLSDPAKKAFLNLYEMYRETDVLLLDPAVRQMAFTAPAFIIEAWPAKKNQTEPDLAFQIFDADRKIVEPFNTGRRPASEVLAILRGADLPNQLASV